MRVMVESGKGWAIDSFVGIAVHNSCFGGIGSPLNLATCVSKVSKLGESRELLPESILEVVEVDLDPLHLVLGSGLLDEGEEVGGGRGARLKDGQHVDL